MAPRFPALRRRRGATGAGETTTGSASSTGAACAAGCASSQSWIANISARQPSPLIAEMPNTGSFQRSALTNALHARLALVFRHEVELVQHEPARLRGELRIVFLELLGDRARIGNRIGVRIGRRDVDEMQQQARALQVAQELVAEARAFGGAFDQSRNVGDDEAASFVGAHDAELRRERRERIVGDLGPRRRDRADQRRLAGVGQAEQADVGEHLELELQRAAARLARRVCVWRGARLVLDLKCRLPRPPLPPLATSARAASWSRSAISSPGVGVGDHGADRHAQHDVVGAAAVLVRAAPVLAALGAMDARVAIVDQRVDVAIGDCVDAAAAAAVAAVGTAARDVFLAPERRDAVAAVAGDDFDQRFVEEFHAVLDSFDRARSARSRRRGGRPPSRRASRRARAARR